MVGGIGKYFYWKCPEINRLNRFRRHAHESGQIYLHIIYIYQTHKRNKRYTHKIWWQKWLNQSLLTRTSGSTSAIQPYKINTHVNAHSCIHVSSLSHTFSFSLTHARSLCVSRARTHSTTHHKLKRFLLRKISPRPWTPTKHHHFWQLQLKTLESQREKKREREQEVPLLKCQANKMHCKKDEMIVESIKFNEVESQYSTSRYWII